MRMHASVGLLRRQPRHAHILGAARHAHRACRRANSAFDYTTRQRRAHRQTATRPGLFGGGLFGGLAAGFLGAGLFGLLFGHGLFGGLAGFASIIGPNFASRAGRDRRPADFRLVAAA